jgi:hypothetical protein
MHTPLRGSDLLFSTARTARNHGYNIYDTLFSTDSKFRIKPQMADSFETSADGLVWTFQMPSGLKFHDGAPVKTATNHGLDGHRQRMSVSVVEPTTFWSVRYDRKSHRAQLSIRYSDRNYDRSVAGLGTGKAQRYFASDFDLPSDCLFEAREIAGPADRSPRRWP